mmetsp:Transcript_16570/g.56494  ORF Transcript_16570/g.56494 Transcript_16570/m.56494 type:complete len:209 (-) Transcript_16570:1155-1781(-)
MVRLTPGTPRSRSSPRFEALTGFSLLRWLCRPPSLGMSSGLAAPRTRARTGNLSLSPVGSSSTGPSILRRTKYTDTSTLLSDSPGGGRFRVACRFLCTRWLRNLSKNPPSLSPPHEGDASSSTHSSYCCPSTSAHASPSTDAERFMRSSLQLWSVQLYHHTVGMSLARSPALGTFCVSMSSRIWKAAGSSTNLRHRSALRSRAQARPR